ncbi:MAG: D-2-hydroxyacid dehydrogenase [Clostridiaceae bacterium]|nr:D-2-hydroxyacid dehydrogenase [Clostridiaceae bacterium]
MKIVVLDGHTLNPGDLSWEKLNDLGDVTIYDRTASRQIMERAKGADIILVNKTILTKEIINKLDNLKYIGVLATGYNVVDIEATIKKGIVVTNVPNYSSNSVAQLVFAFILEFCNRVGDHSNSTRKGEWFNKKDFCYWKYPIMELSGKNIGIIGYGNIGKKVALLAEAYEMNILIHSRSKKEKENVNVKQVTLEELLTKSDFVTIHCPLNEETRNLINKDSLNLMKSSSYLINTSRGSIINEVDLAFALDAHSIAGAGLDVISIEPPKENNPLFLAKNCIITPHIGWASKEARGRLLNIAIENINSFLEGRPENVIK